MVRDIGKERKNREQVGSGMVREIRKERKEKIEEMEKKRKGEKWR